MASSPSIPTHQVARLGGHNGGVHAVTYSAGQGQYILTGSSDRQVRLFNPSRAPSSSSPHPPGDPPTAAAIQTYSAHGHAVLDLAVSADNARFASVGGDKLVFLWDVARAVTLRRFAGHGGRVEACAFGGSVTSVEEAAGGGGGGAPWYGGDGSVLVSGSFDGTVKVWDCRASGGRPMVSLSEAGDGVSCVRCTRGGEIVAGGTDGRVRTYDVRMGNLDTDVIGQPVTSITVTRREDAFLVGTLDSTLRLVDRATGRLLNSFTSPKFRNTTYRIRSALAANDAIALSGTQDGRVLAWDVLSGKVLHTLQHAGGEGATAAGTVAGESKSRDVVSAVAVCPRKGGGWCSAGGDGTVIVWGTPAS